MGILSWIIVGLIVGALAQAITRNDAKHPWWVLIILGIIGGVVGGWLAQLLFNIDFNGFWDWQMWLFSLIGAVLVTAIYEAITRGGSKGQSRVD